MKLALKILALVLVLGVIGGAAYYYLSNPRVTESTSIQVASCTNPSGKNIYEQGTSAFQAIGQSGSSTNTDYCDYFANGEYSRVGQLKQTYCDKGMLVSETVDCGLGSICRQGICMKGGDESWSLCNDSDNGMDMKIRGHTGQSGEALDQCWTSTNKIDPENVGGFTDKCVGPDCYQYEYYCNGDERVYKISPSPLGCENGATK